VADTHVAPHELYLAGLGQMERWDKTANLDSAIHSFDEAVQADPSFALAFSGLGEAYWAKYRLDPNTRWLDKAEQNSRRAAELSNNIPAVYVTLARVHNGRGHYNLAVQEIQKALRLDPNGADALLTEAEIYAGMGRHDEAEGIYKRASALRPLDWVGPYELGAFYFRRQRYPEAAAQFEHVLEVTPDNSLAHATLGGMLQMLGKTGEAEAHLKHSLALQPSYTAFVNLGVLYYNAKRWAEAADMTKKALELNATDWAAWSNLGQTYQWLGRMKDAQEAFGNELVHLEEAIKVSPDNPTMQVALGVLYARKKLQRKAVPQIQAALTRSPDDPFILVSAGEAYSYLGIGNLRYGWFLERWKKVGH
jgi:serine/threonine-protein kinase